MVWMACSWLRFNDGPVELPLILRKKRRWAMTHFLWLELCVNGPQLQLTSPHSLSAAVFFSFFLIPSQYRNDIVCVYTFLINLFFIYISINTIPFGRHKRSEISVRLKVVQANILMNPLMKEFIFCYVQLFFYNIY